MSAARSNRPLTFVIRHDPTRREWTLLANPLLSHDVQFADSVSDQAGPPGLVGAIRWCYELSSGNPALVLIESEDGHSRLRFHNEPNATYRAPALPIPRSRNPSERGLQPVWASNYGRDL